ncbi:MAG: penicillin-binding transpeptidase domain-containing protein [Clostridiales bacterium]
MKNNKRIYFIGCFLLVFAFILMGRLVWLQIFHHDEMVAYADKQQVKTVEISVSHRGDVLDRNGAIITNNTEKPALLVFPSLVNDVNKTATIIGEIANLDIETISNKIAGNSKKNKDIRYLPFYAKSNLTPTEVADFKEANLNGVFVVGEVSRYQNDTPMMHLLGSLAVVTREDVLKNTVKSDYKEGDFKGASGLERIYEKQLKGTKGRGFAVVVDEKNKIIKPDNYYIFNGDNKKNKSTVKLTVDLGIQRCLENAFGEKSGAGVILDSKTGDVLAMASAPKYDPLFINAPKSDDAYVNKALKSYAPASLFKIFDTAIALEKGIIQKETPVYCNGVYTLDNGREIHCWKEHGHGAMTFNSALAKSCNPVYVDLGLKLGANNLEKAFKKWELDKDILLGYDLKMQSSLNLGSKTTGEIANAVLGENGVLLTPLNLAKLINVIACGGYLTVPRLVTEVNSGANEMKKTFPHSFAVRVISAKTADTVKNMMAETFQLGTGASLGLNNLDIAGKTGTSETGSVWIGGFFPTANPKYTIVILVEDGKSGVGDGGPILKKVCGYLQGLQ